MVSFVFNLNVVISMSNVNNAGSVDPAADGWSAVSDLGISYGLRLTLDLQSDMKSGEQADAVGARIVVHSRQQVNRIGLSLFARFKLHPVFTSAERPSRHLWH